MRYRGFEIDCNASSDKEMIYSMSVYDGADDLRKHCLYELYDIDTDGDINEKVMSIVDDNYDEITLNQNYYRSERNRELLGRLATCLRESLDNASLYQTLNELVGMTDDEIRSIGLTDLAPYFDRDCYAQTIAEFITDKGTSDTMSGNYIVPFKELEDRFGVDLSNDEDMRNKVLSAFDKDVVADVEATEDGFDMIFYTSYCPNYYEESSPNWGC